MVEQQGCEQHAEMNEREAEGLAGELVRIVAPQLESIDEEADAQDHGRRQVEPGTHAVDHGHQAGCEQDQGSNTY